MASKPLVRSTSSPRWTLQRVSRNLGSSTTVLTFCTLDDFPHDSEEDHNEERAVASERVLISSGQDLSNQSVLKDEDLGCPLTWQEDTISANSEYNDSHDKRVPSSTANGRQQIIAQKKAILRSQRLESGPVRQEVFSSQMLFLHRVVEP